MSEDGSAASSASWPRHYPVEFNVDYPDRDLDRVSTAFRLVLILPILVLLGSPSGAYHVDMDIDVLVSGAGGVVVVPPLLMILFRRKSAISVEPLRLSPLRISGGPREIRTARASIPLSRVLRLGRMEQRRSWIGSVDTELVARSRVSRWSV